MRKSKHVDYYEALQISPRADHDTIERVFRHLARRFHPDNSESGDADRFSEVLAAYRTLSDPEQRAAYDVTYSEVQRQQWRIFDQASAASDFESDQRIHLGILAVLYQARRGDVDNAGVGIVDLERILDCSQEHIRFHVWYLREKGWIERLGNGMLAITVAGIEHLDEEKIPWKGDTRRLLVGHTEADERQAGPAVDDDSPAAKERMPKAAHSR